MSNDTIQNGPPNLLEWARMSREPVRKGDLTLCTRCGNWFKPSFELERTCADCERNSWSAEKTTDELAKLGY